MLFVRRDTERKETNNNQTKNDNRSVNYDDTLQPESRR